VHNTTLNKGSIIILNAVLPIHNVTFVTSHKTLFINIQQIVPEISEPNISAVRTSCNDFAINDAFQKRKYLIVDRLIIQTLYVSRYKRLIFTNTHQNGAVARHMFRLTAALQHSLCYRQQRREYNRKKFRSGKDMRSNTTVSIKMFE